jgi:hypothetical protein
MHKAAFTPENAAMLLVLEQQHCRSTFRDTDSQFARPPRRNAER